MLQKLGVGVFLFTVLSSCRCQWTTHLVGVDPNPKWKIRGSQITNVEGNLELFAKAEGIEERPQRGLTDHLVKDTGANLETKMNSVVRFFETHYDEILEVNNDNTRVSKHGFNYNVYGISVELTEAFGREVLDSVIDLGRVLIAFKFVDRGPLHEPRWELTHLGPIAMAGNDEAIRGAINRLRQEQEPRLQALLDRAREHIPANDERMTGFIDRINRIPGIGQLASPYNPANNYNIQLPEALPQNPQNPVISNLRLFQSLGEVPTLTTEMENYVGRQIAQMAAAQRAQQQRAQVTAASAGEDPTPAQSLMVRQGKKNRHRQTGRPGERKRRSTNPPVTLNAELELMDSDPNSEFMISRIEFKERYRQGQDTEFTEETHCVDFENNVFVTDPNKAGSKLTAEIEENGTFKPAKVEEAQIVKRISIVLKPRGA